MKRELGENIEKEYFSRICQSDSTVDHETEGDIKAIDASDEHVKVKKKESIRSRNQISRRPSRTLSESSSSSASEAWLTQSQAERYKRGIRMTKKLHSSQKSAFVFRKTPKPIL